MTNSVFSALRRAAACIALMALSGSALALSCPVGKVEQGGLCYNPPRAGYTCTAAACMQDCPSGYSPSVPGFCHYRGSLTYTETPYITKNSSHPHKCLALYYGNCRADYNMDVCGICSYKGAWDTVRRTYFREPGLSPDFSQAFNRIGTTMQGTYGDSIGSMQSAYYAAAADIQKAIDAVTLRIFHEAAKAALANDVGTTLKQALAAFKAAKADADSLNDMKRILALAAATKDISKDAAAMQDIKQVMMANAIKLGFVSASQVAEQSTLVAATSTPSNVQNSSFGLFVNAGGAWAVGADQSFAIIMNTKADDEGKWRFAIVATTGGSVGLAAILGADIGLAWSPGTVDKQGGAFVGLTGAADLAVGVGVGATWSVAKGMRGAQNAIPGVSMATGVGVGGQLSLTGGNSWILQKWSTP